MRLRRSSRGPIRCLDVLRCNVGEKIVLMLRNKATEMQDNGVWIATTEEHHASLRREFPQMRSIQLFGGKISAGRCSLLTNRTLRPRRCA